MDGWLQKGASMKEVSRRSFVAGTGAATASLAFGTGAAFASEVEAWDYETEILICGYGGSGAVTAITAHDNGAKVLIIEKQAEDDGDVINQTNSTRLAFSAMMNFKSEDLAKDYLKAVSRGATPDEVIDGWAPYAATVAEWVMALPGGDTLNFAGDETSEYPEELLPEGKNYDCYNFMGQGLEMWQVLNGAVRERGIEILFETPLDKLVLNAEGAVVGAIAQGADGEVRIHATKAVVLSTGGFEHNDDMLNQYIWCYPTRYYANPGNTGDGIRAAQAVGADLWHMSLAGGRLVPYFEDLGFALQNGTPSPFFIVDHYGKRYMNEKWKSHSALWEAFYFDTDLCDFPASPSFSIFDQSALDDGPVVRGGMLQVHPDIWSDDNQAEIEKGWILKGDTIEELGEKIAADPEVGGKMDPAALAATLAKFNEYAAAGEDPDFGRTGFDGLETPPFYALKLYPGGVNTFGGPRRNGKGQIVKPDGEAIPGLYGTGEMGSILGFLYSGGGWNISEVVCSGRIAGDNAVNEPSRA